MFVLVSPIHGLCPPGRIAIADLAIRHDILIWTRVSKLIYTHDPAAGNVAGDETRT